MTREQCKKLLESGVLPGWAEGQVLQEVATNGDWYDLPNPEFTRSPECYRLKPKPREWWVPEWDDPDLTEQKYHGRPRRECRTIRDVDMTRPPDRWIKVREIVEETQ